jgi:hypothetical protein
MREASAVSLTAQCSPTSMHPRAQTAATVQLKSEDCACMLLLITCTQAGYNAEMIERINSRIDAEKAARDVSTAVNSTKTKST